MAKQRKGTGSPRQNPPKAEPPVASTRSPGRSEPDWAIVARAVGTGFIILALGSVTKIPLAVMFTAVVSAAVAGVLTGRLASKPVLYGALAAVLSLALTVPVWYFLSFFPIVPIAILHVVAAVVVGALAGRIGARSAGG